MKLLPLLKHKSAAGTAIYISKKMLQDERADQIDLKLADNKAI